ncbi:2,3-bisphosphoglycerate-independent phosphoglycerate mutase [Candidatus Dependentiae bacterium]|nr:2,3-bisphosphoglycerate-independent phosphoglycerate mutase [Candidatus Dependentiae bacterium]MCC7415037.1 2,3-bisphosphoglycerate-independent phosphoglycerate mutase [Campylobacterota bacterium]
MQPIGPRALVILDGFGRLNYREHNAIAQAATPHLDQWFGQCPSALVRASGESVGLPAGAIGNSEVGHMTIGTGRVIPQAVTLVEQAIGNKSFYDNPVLKEALARVKVTSNRLHIMGLCSDAKVHSDIGQLYAYVTAAHRAGIQNVFLHLFLDGRDVAPHSAERYLEAVEHEVVCRGYGLIGSLHGRFYAMDRDKNFERTKKSYDVLVGAAIARNSSWRQLLDLSYTHGITDEFFEPTLLRSDACIQPGDGVISFNIRPERIEQLTRSLIDPACAGFGTKPLSLSCFVTPVSYGQALATDILFPSSPLEHTFKDTLAAAHKTIFVIAETEKYAHVTYFFNGMREQAVLGETRVLIPSLKVATYADSPAMSAPAITQAVLATLKQPYDFYLINYANADMVGHSGDFAATVRAIECLDAQLGLLYDAFVVQQNGMLYITADHGNAEDMFDEATQQPRTAHTTNPVPFLVVTKNGCSAAASLPLHELADIAPYILHDMGLPVPIEMRK